MCQQTDNICNKAVEPSTILARKEVKNRDVKPLTLSPKDAIICSEVNQVSPRHLVLHHRLFQEPGQLELTTSLPYDRIFWPHSFVGNKIKCLSSFAHVVRDHVNRTRTTRTCERFVYSIVQITRFYDFQTTDTFVCESREVRKDEFVCLFDLD